MIEETHFFHKLPLGHLDRDFDRAYLEIYGVNHLRPTYSALIFFRDKLPKKINPGLKGYAGTLAVFGHSDCWGDKGHCHGADGLRRFDSRPSHPMTRAFKRVPVTHALREVMKSGRKTLDLAIHVQSREAWDDQGDRSLLCCKGMQLVTL